MVMRAWPSRVSLSIEVTPATDARRRSIGVVTSCSISSRELEAALATIISEGRSICGNNDNGNFSSANVPSAASAIVATITDTGRRRISPIT